MEFVSECFQLLSVAYACCFYSSSVYVLLLPNPNPHYAETCGWTMEVHAVCCVTREPSGGLWEAWELFFVLPLCRPPMVYGAPWACQLWYKFKERMEAMGQKMGDRIWCVPLTMRSTPLICSPLPIHSRTPLPFLSPPMKSPLANISALIRSIVNSICCCFSVAAQIGL